MPQPTLFNFFCRTPKASTSSPTSSRNGGTPNSATANGDHQNGDSGEEKATASTSASTPKSTPKSSLTSSGSGQSPRTPVSSRNGSGGGIKRRRTENETTPGDQSIGSKKSKSGDPESPSKDYTSGSLVWALLEGYPWWPAMIRGEAHRGDKYYKAQSSEFHVQFFDNPPTRAWIRKCDLKPFTGSTTADIPPAKSDRGWKKACLTADFALMLKNSQRIDKYWHDFSGDQNQDGAVESEDNDNDDEVQEMEVEEHEEDEKEAPKTRRGREIKKHKRIRTLSTSSEEDDDGETKIKSRKQRKGKKKEEDDYSPTKNGSAEEQSESSESAVGSEELSEAASEDDSEGEAGRRKSKSAGKKGQSNSGTSRFSTPALATPKAGGINRSDFKNRLQQLSVSGAQSPTPSSSLEKNDCNTTGTDKEQTVWTHMTWPWAAEGKRQDARRRKETDPEYDPRTLFAPLDFLKTLSPAQRQWWDFKTKNFDTILFFKVGKFYEFYHWDACIAAKELGITYMKGDYAHSGFPEISFSRFANVLVEKGYKVARIEQTETPDSMNERVKNSKVKVEKNDRVIKREICQIATKGVRYASFQDDAISSPFSPEAVYLYGVVEKPSSSPNEAAIFGVCFINTTIGTFHIGQFTDDRHASRLRTLFSHFVPGEILYEKNKLSPALQQLFQNMSSVRKDPLLSDSEFWNAKTALKFLADEGYFRDSDGTSNWPSAFKTVLSENDGLGLTPDENWELGVKSLGGVLWYLKFCLLEHDLLSQKRFEIYKPVDATTTTVQNLPQRCDGPKYMVLDGITIRNLDILTGPISLLSTIDKCGTNFGKRLLRHWLCLPLAIPEEIVERQDTVEELMMSQKECRDKVIPLLKSLPDLERLLSKIHYLGRAHRSQNHPDGRANFFEEVKYSKNKIGDFLTTLKGFKTCVKIIQQFKGSEGELESKLLKQLVASFPVLDELLSNFDNAFDHQVALREGKIKPKKGAVEAYDDAVQAVENIQTEADGYLKQVARELGTRAVYFGSDKKRFQIEVPEKTKVSRDFEMSGSKKGFKRYHSSRTKELLSAIMRAETEREEILRDIARQIFEKFDKHRETWIKAVECIVNLDVLISLSLFSESQEVMCRPVISYSEDSAFIDIVQGRHPCIAFDSYIPNDARLGLSNEEGSPGNFVILTGPNMGGKSTLMHQVGLLAVLSHLGCYVPAEKCEMSVVDRIFTRLGANDNIGEGESTFFVEMSESSAILKHATPDSLLLIDELGRGTATYDGTAIAYAVAKELSTRNCRSLFSTHYHTLVEALQDYPSIQMSHMACMVENENEEDPTQESITFLYKMISGPCPKSYGFNAARLAGINDAVIRVAHKKAKELEASVAGVRSFTDICSGIREKKLSLKDFAALKI